MCHEEVAKQFAASVHGRALEQGIPQAPLCTDCHGEHSIARHTSPASPVNAGHIRETCGRCHGDLRLARKFGLPADRILSFDASFHGLAAKAGSQTVANCASCHGVHNILPSGDPKSTTHPANLPATCGRCHTGAGERFAIGPVHLAEGGNESAGVRWVRRFYLIAIPLVIGLMFLHNAGDWIRKTARLRFQTQTPEPGNTAYEVRMLPFERLQHALLALSFLVLAWTGFALKYPDHLWALPLTAWETHWAVRSYVHRGAAAVFSLAAAAHLVSLFVSPALRRHWMTLIPRRADAAEGFRRFLYNLGFLKAPPSRSAHSYVEKAEYWAVVWGSAVMILSGVMLWANSLVMRWLPKGALDLATSVHYYEAVLATLAIVVWHFYFAIFDPDVYPMDTAWLTGMGKKKTK
jgi:cytochrome b subunit of formate dehydrogenase